MDTHTDDFIEQGPGIMQSIVRRAVSGREGPTAFLAAIAPPSALRGDVEGVSNDVAFTCPSEKLYPTDDGAPGASSGSKSEQHSKRIGVGLHAAILPAHKSHSHNGLRSG